MTEPSFAELKAQKLAAATVIADLGELGAIKKVQTPVRLGWGQSEKFIIDEAGTEAARIKGEAFGGRRQAFDTLREKITRDKCVVDATKKLNELRNPAPVDLEVRLTQGKQDPKALKETTKNAETELKAAKLAAKKAAAPELKAFQESHGKLQTIRANARLEQAEAVEGVLKTRTGIRNAVSADTSMLKQLHANLKGEAKPFAKAAESAATTVAESGKKWGFKGNAAVAIGAVGVGYLGYKWLTRESQQQPSFVDMEIQRRTAQQAAMGQGRQ